MLLLEVNLQLVEFRQFGLLVLPSLLDALCNLWFGDGLSLVARLAQH